MTEFDLDTVKMLMNIFVRFGSSAELQDIEHFPGHGPQRIYQICRYVSRSS